MVSSRVEETTGLGAAKGYGTTLGYGTTTGYGTMGRKDTFGGIKEYRESGVNMAFLDSYFSEVNHYIVPSKIWRMVISHY